MVYPPGLRGTCSGLPTGFERGRLWGHFILCSTCNKILSPKRFLITRVIGITGSRLISIIRVCLFFMVFRLHEFRALLDLDQSSVCIQCNLE